MFFSIVLNIRAQSVNIIESGGWFETAYVEWETLSSADSYNVYYSGNGVVNQIIDNPLIRSYGSYFRADVVGISAGIYTITVVPVIGGTEADAAVTGDISVFAHDRSGFAFSNGRIPGGYKMDGTPKDGAVIIYLTENTKNTVSLDITGATTNPCVGIQTIFDGIKKGEDNRPFIIRMVGQVTDMDYMLNGDVVIENENYAASHITIEGIGEDAVADGWGIRIKNATNVEIRNIGTINCDSGEGDNIGLQQNNDYIWVHNCDFFYGDAGSDADQAKGDGALDCKKSTYVTFSYNHFWDSGKCNLLGLSENITDGLYITYHHNWYDHSDSRHPRVRFYSAHVYNNYYDGNSKYGIGSTEGSSIFAEGNYFRNCKYPMLTSMQGSDVYDIDAGANDYGDMPTFSSEDGGTIKAYNNYMEGQRRFVPYGDPTTSSPDPTVDFDAYVVSARNETIPSSVVSSYGSNAYNNFDVDNSVMYSYTPQSPSEAKTTVMDLSGRMNGGDLQWTFDNAVDDASYAVIAGLKDVLVNYSTNLVYIQGEGEPENIPPSVVIETPVAGSGFDLGENIALSASATDVDGTITSVAFFARLADEATATEILTDNSNPYTASWTPSIAGTYYVYCVATDNDGRTSTSEHTYSILIDDPNVNDAPSVTVTTDRELYIENSDVEITALATDDNSVSYVEIYNGTTLLTSISTSPYVYTISSVAIGNYSISAIAYDEEGLSSTAECSFSVEEQNVSDLVHNYTESGLASTFFSISGNLSTSQGTVEYNGLTLTQCLKIESSTSITFTTNAESEFVLVFNNDYSGGINIDGVSYVASSGIVTVSLAAGVHTVIKEDVANVYYMSITYTNTVVSNIIELQQGWNIIGCPINGVTDVEIALTSIWDKVISVKNEESYFLITNPEFLNSLETLEWGQGYLVKVSEPCLLDW